MCKLRYLLCIILLLARYHLSAQNIFVDVQKGSDLNPGSQDAPLATLTKAMEHARVINKNENVTIKVLPGLYVLNDKVTIDKPNTEEAWLTIEAAIMPDDADWTPTQMPVIQSISSNNSTTQFPHAIGLLIATGHVSIRGLKFLGNPNPNVKYYYPINREDSTLTGLNVSQCYFIGEKNSAPIQGSIWAHGAATHVDHCIFFGIKNALLLFKGIKDFSLTYSIISGAYEAAVWYGPFNHPFIFQNNIVADSEYLWLRQENTFPKYEFSDCLFTGLKHYMGYYAGNGAVPAERNGHTERNVGKTGKLLLSEVGVNGLPKDYLNPISGSEGTQLRAGIFKKTAR
ncbi:hypothetical protein LZD49_00380 [Dyadobacter sp. CY261]|uniref:hypothetical protein n=1 Tax=Dyadobacter sp. CY261 TaxID=2907203 RepID=UPI001F172AF3|nr:hypothetical protein [Dyadobacter sp. CY261]MCF0068903.1 hypothetical protein [Dyadobacter sp. CY261]